MAEGMAIKADDCTLGLSESRYHFYLTDEQWDLVRTVCESMRAQNDHSSFAVRLKAAASLCELAGHFERGSQRYKT